MWNCSGCTFENNNYTKRCKMCGTSQPAKPVTPPQPSVNPTPDQPPSRPASAPTRRQRTPTTPANQLPNCPICTYINPAGTRSCEMCGADLTVVASEQVVSPGSIRPRRRLQRQTSLTADLREADVREALQLWRHIRDFCKSHHTPFVDDAFPPVSRSLSRTGRLATRQVQWLRCDKIRPYDTKDRMPWAVYRAPVPDDICQGQLGNCWFLSALAVLAERPELLEEIIITKDFCPEGVYQVRLCKDGNWQIVIIDDVFPCDEHGRLIFSRARRKQLWVPLIEKAFAKLHGCYGALTAGHCVEGLAALTGQPCESISLRNKKHGGNDWVDHNLIWAQLLSCRESKFLMGAGCGAGSGKSDQDVYKAVGLQSNHAYSILDVKDVEGNKLVRLRNPWGSKSWIEDWSDNSNKWRTISPHLKKKLLEGSGPGLFWMSLEDLIKYFYAVAVCKVRPDWQESRIQGHLPFSAQEPPKIVQITVQNTTEFDIGLFQPFERTLEEAPFVPDVFVAIFLESSSDQEAFGPLVSCSPRRLRSYVGCKTMLKPGNYLITVLSYSPWSLGPYAREKRDFTLCIHNSKDVIVDVLNTSGHKYRHAHADAVIQITMCKGKKQEVFKGKHAVTCYALVNDWFGGFFVMENRGHDRGVHVDLDCSSSSNLVSTREAMVTADSVPPLHRQVIMVLSQLYRTGGATIAQKFNFRQSGRPGSASNNTHQPPIDRTVSALHEPRPV